MVKNYGYTYNDDPLQRGTQKEGTEASCEDDTCTRHGRDLSGTAEGAGETRRWPRAWVTDAPSEPVG